MGPLIIDVQDNGIGDVIVASWLVTSARAVGHTVLLNPRAWRELPLLLGIRAGELTERAADNWTRTPGIGLQYEYACPDVRRTRFALWAESLGLPPLRPVRPPYREEPAAAAWADAQWGQADPAGTKPRALVFPSAARAVRRWPLAYFCDLVADLGRRGWVVAAMADARDAVAGLDCAWWCGTPIVRVAAMAARADVVVATDSGPAHLAGTIGVRTLSIAGPTRGAVVFGHDPNVTPVSLSRRALACVGCRFSRVAGYRSACELGGCQALMRLDPATVGRAVEQTWRPTA